MNQLESALLRFARQMKNPSNPNATSNPDDASGSAPAKGPIKDMQALIRSGANLVPFRDLTVSFPSTIPYV
jgi:hypothetical protein